MITLPSFTKAELDQYISWLSKGNVLRDVLLSCQGKPCSKCKIQSVAHHFPALTGKSQCLQAAIYILSELAPETIMDMYL